jgi:hypothetical protein
MFYRSSWELKIAEFLDASSMVCSYRSEPFIISYIDANGVKRGTRPDFLVLLADGRRVLIEVKPEGLMSYRNNQEKINGMREYCQKEGIQFVLATDNLFNSVAVLDDTLFNG